MSQRLPGRFLVALACDGRVRVMCAVMEGPADELRARHTLEPTAARLGAEGLVAAGHSGDWVGAGDRGENSEIARRGRPFCKPGGWRVQGDSPLTTFAISRYVSAWAM